MAPVELGIPGDPRFLKVVLKAGESHIIELPQGRNPSNDRLLRRRICIICQSDDQRSVVNHALVEGDPRLRIGRLALGFKNERVLDQGKAELTKGQGMTLQLSAPDDIIEPLDFLEIKHT